MRLLTGFTLCLILHIAFVNCQTFSQCNGKPSGVYISGQYGCQSYIYCDGDRSYESTCPFGLAFNTADGTCDDASKVQCNDEIGSPPRPTPSSPFIPKVVCPPISKGDNPVFVSSPDTCSEYYMCLYGDTIGLKCSNNLHFNSDTQRCEPPESANCKIGETPLSTLASTVWPSTPLRTTTPTGATRVSTTPIIPSTHTKTTVPVTTRQTTTPVTPPRPTTPVTGTTRLTTTPVTPTRTTTPVTGTTRVPTTPVTPPVPVTGTTTPVTGTTRLTTTPVTPTRTTTPVTGTTRVTTTPVTAPVPVTSTQTTPPVTGTTWLTTTPVTPTWSPSWSSTAIPTIDPAYLCDLQPTGYFAYPEDCRFYYRCLNGFPSKQECPKGYGWDVNKKMCTTSGCSA